MKRYITHYMLVQHWRLLFSLFDYVFDLTANEGGANIWYHSYGLSCLRTGFVESHADLVFVVFRM